MSVLEVRKLTVSIGGKLLCRELDMTLTGGSMTGLLGRNGAGKSTLLYTLMGFHHPDAGSIRIQGAESNTLSRRTLARRAAILLQETDFTMPATVLELALTGRHPHVENLLWDDPVDFDIVHHVLTLTDLNGFEDRQVASLSGGEKQRLALALVLIQEPQLFLLDEPSNHLDVDYQLKILSLLKEQVQRKNAGICMASHDINLVARYCDRVLIMFDGGEWVEGPRDSVLDEANLGRAFGCSFARINHDGQIYFLPGHLQ